MCVSISPLNLLLYIGYYIYYILDIILKCHLSGLSVNVGESMITQSSKVRDLGVIFDQFLNFDDHITAYVKAHIFIFIYLLQNHTHIRNMVYNIDIQ